MSDENRKAKQKIDFFSLHCQFMEINLARLISNQPIVICILFCLVLTLVYHITRRACCLSAVFLIPREWSTKNTTYLVSIYNCIARSEEFVGNVPLNVETVLAFLPVSNNTAILLSKSLVNLEPVFMLCRFSPQTCGVEPSDGAGTAGV